MKKRHNKIHIKGSTSFFASFMAIVVGLLFGLIILLISNSKQAFPAFLTILIGGFADGTKGIGQELYYATPIILTGLSVGFAFKTGLFNIGASGQFTCGAFAAIFIGIKGAFLPSGIHWLIALLAAIIAGAIWGMVPGILKALANVNEVITSIMMNYIGIYMVNMAIVKTIYDPLKNQTKPVLKSAILPKAGLDKLFNANNLNIGILIALLSVIIIYILLQKTTFGYELKACGQNKSASKYAGINEKKSIILSMTIAGGLAGLGGGLLYLSGSGKYLQVLDVLSPEGFNGISVALLGMSHPIGILFAGLFIAHITVGGFNIQLYSFVPEVVDMIVAAIIYCGAFALLIKNFINNINKKPIEEVQVLNMSEITIDEIKKSNDKINVSEAEILEINETEKTEENNAENFETEKKEES